MKGFIRHAGLVLALLAAGCDSTGPGAMPAPVAPPALTFPADGAEGLASVLSLRWRAAADTLTYHAQVAETPDFAAPVVDRTGLTAPFLCVDALTPGTTYYWRVRTRAGAGESDWSPVRRFTPERAVSLPVRPTLDRPADGARDQPTAVTLRWNDAPGACTYRVEMALDADFLLVVADLVDVADTTQDVTGLVHTYTYYWRVQGANPAGTGPWSPTWKMIVKDGTGG